MGYYFIFPTLALFAIFIAYPLVRSVMISLTQWPGFGPSTFVGLANFRAMFSDPVFRTALLNTVVFCAVTTIIQTAIPLGLAALLNARVRYSAVFRVAIFLPASDVACRFRRSMGLDLRARLRDPRSVLDLDRSPQPCPRLAFEHRDSPARHHCRVTLAVHRLFYSHLLCRACRTSTKASTKQPGSTAPPWCSSSAM